MSRARVEDAHQAHRLRWFLAAHLLAALAIFEASLWIGQHLARQPVKAGDTVPVTLTVARDGALRPK